jgi:hypothetical protein
MAEFVIWLTFPSGTCIVKTAACVMLASCLLCGLLFMASFFRWHLKGLWLALPAAVAFALPIYVIVTLEMEIDACVKQPGHPICVP